MQTKIGEMTVAVYDSNAALGQAAAHDFAALIRQAVAQRGDVSVIFATGNAQFSFLAALHNVDVPWERLTAFHMDEYLGISDQHPASFQRFIRERIADEFQPRAVYYMQGDTQNAQSELDRYTALL